MNLIYSPSHIRGSGLIELMISISLGLIIISGLSHIYLHSKTNHQSQSIMSNLHSEGHYALSQLINDIRNADYLGNTRRAEYIKGTTSPIPASGRCQNNNQWVRMLDQSIFGLNENIKVNKDLDYSKCIKRDNYLGGDVVALRFVSKTVYSASEVSSKDNQDRIYLLSSPEKGLLFQGKELSKNTLESRLTTLHQAQGSLYYIGKAVNDIPKHCVGTKPYPALFRKSPNKRSILQREEISQGIENMQIQYGIDTDLNQSVNYYTDAAIDTPWTKVASVRVWLLMRAQCPEPGYTNKHTYTLGDQTYTPSDNYRRLLLTSTVAINHRGIH